MKRYYLAILLILLFPINIIAQTALSPTLASLSLNANNTAAPQTGTIYAIPQSCNTLTWIISFGSAPASATTVLEFSNDNSTYTVADTSTNVSGESRTVFTAARFVRTTETARSGGSAITTSIVCKNSSVALLSSASNSFSQVLFGDGSVTTPSVAPSSNPTTGFYKWINGYTGWTTSSLFGGLFLFNPNVNNGTTGANNVANINGYIRTQDVAGGLSFHGYTGTSPTVSALELAGRAHDATAFPALQLTALRYTTANGFGALPATEYAFRFCESEAVSATGCDHIYSETLGSGRINRVVWGTFSSAGYQTTSTAGDVLQPGILAQAAFPVQISPYYSWLGYAWDTSASKSVEFRAEVLPVSAATPTGTWKLNYSLNNAATTTPFSVTSAGVSTTNFYASTASSILTISANVITPTNSVHHLGAGLVKTITVPAGMTTGYVDIVPDAAFTTDATGNISLASTAVINRTLRFTWDGTKWNPSY